MWHTRPLLGIGFIGGLREGRLTQGSACQFFGLDACHRAAEIIVIDSLARVKSDWPSSCLPFLHFPPCLAGQVRGAPCTKAGC